MNKPMPTDNTAYDFFVSYARSDNGTGWITRFVEELLVEHKRFSSGRHLYPFFDQHAINTGADWQLYLAHGIAHSRLFLAFLSPNYFASEWCRKEWRAWMDAEIAQHILTAGVRPIYIVEVPGLTGKGQLSDQQLAQKLAELSKLPESDRAKLIAETPPVVKHLRRRQLTHNQPFCDVHAFFDAGLDALRREDLRQVLDQLAHDLDHHAALLAQADASLSTVPAYNKHFTGRLDELLLLRERLIKDDRTGVIYGIQGLGGIGKTELALTYAHAYASAYPGGRFLIRCEGKSVLRDAVLGQSDFTGLFGDQISDEERKLPDAYFAAILRCLRARLDRLGHVLLVLDNVSDLALLGHPQTQALTALGPQLHLLATTRLIPPAGGKGNWFSLGQLPDDDALDLLEKYRPFANASEREAAGRIVKRLGGFTLAVELAAAHLAEHPDVTCARMAEIIGLEDLENPVVVESADRQNIRYEHDRRLSAVLGPTLAALSPAERRALEYAALLPPDHVPLPWLKTLVVADFPEIGQPARLTDPWNDLWRRLEKLALFTRSEEETTEPRLMRVHRLVQELVRPRLAQADLAARQQAVDAVVKERAGALEKETHWEEARWELEPFGALAELWADTKHPEAAWLLSHAGLHWHKLAAWTQAELLWRWALAIDEQSFGADHPDVARDLNNLAQLLQATNRLADAEPLMRRALTIDEQSFGADHPDVARDLSNLATLLQATNRLADAEPLMRRALTIDEQSFGADHPDVARDLNNLATLLQATNRLADAEPLMRRALAIDEQNFGADHPTVAIALNNLARLLQATNRLGEAEHLMRRALAIGEQSFGAHHPKVAIGLNNLAALLQATNRLGEAEPLVRRALTIWEQSLGADHPNVASALNNLATLLQATNRLGEAEPLVRRALAIGEQSFGADHPNVAIQLNNLAALLQATNQLADAEPLMRRALAIREASLGANHPDVAVSLWWIAELHKRTNQPDLAKPLMQRALWILSRFTRATGHKHPHLQAAAESSRTLALELFTRGEFAKAEELLKVLLDASFEPASTRHHLARLCLITDRFTEAREHVNQGWAGRGEAKPYIVARLLWFQLALEMLQANAEGRTQNAESILGRLKTVLQSDGACMEWTMQPVLDHLQPKLTETDHALLTSLVAALSNRAKLPELDRFPEWRNATPQPLD